MKVIAKQLGFYDNKRIQAGETFFLHDKKLFSKAWMKSADGKAPKKEKPEVKEEDPVKDDVI